MKFKFISLPIALLLLGVVAGCAPTTTTTSSGGDSNNTTTTTDEPKEFIDYVNNGSVKLTHDYAGKDFYQDGIGQVELKTCIDGDTAHFYPMVETTSSDAIKARFFGIDTPESTGKVQKWGRPASNFTKEKLNLAAENGTIVVSSPFEGYGKPSPDSTGERYVSLVWVNLEKKNAPYDELVLLNLWIVQEGLSWVKNVLDMPKYSDTFYAAEQQARDFKLNMFSDKEDPTWPDSEYQVTSLLDLKRDMENCLKDPSYESVYDNVRVRITGAVAGFSNHILYLQDYFNEEESGTPGGEYASVNIFTGMSPINSKYTKPNTYLEVYGLAQYTENFGFQITDTEGRFPTVSYNDTDTKILLKAEENVDEHQLHTFEYTPAELDKIVQDKNYESLNCSVKVTEKVKVSRAFAASSDEITLYFENYDFQVYISFMYRPDPEQVNLFWTTEEDFVGQEFLISGVYTYHKTMSGKIVYQINPNTSSDLVWVKK